MKILCLNVPQPGATMEQYQPHMLAEVRHGWALYKNGFVRDIYFRQDRPGVAIIAEAESVDAAKVELTQFPLAKVGIIGWEVIPLGAFSNWELLFAPEAAPIESDRTTAAHLEQNIAETARKFDLTP